jgi:hypothetical protein
MEPLRSSKDISPQTGMLVQFVRNSITGEPHRGNPPRRLESRSGVCPGMWDAGSYDILEMSPAPPFFAFDPGEAERAQAIVELVNGAKRTVINSVYQVGCLYRDGLISKEDAVEMMHLIDRIKKDRADAIKERSQASLYPVVTRDWFGPKVQAPWKCGSLGCKTPTAGPLLAKNGKPRLLDGPNGPGSQSRCVVCADKLVAIMTDRSAYRWIPPREVAAAPPPAPAMMGGAVSRRGGRWGQFR